MFPLKSIGTNQPQLVVVVVVALRSLSSPHETAQALSPLLRRCPDRRLLLPAALSLLAHALKSNADNPFLFNLILSSLLPHSLPSARHLFEQMPHRRNLVTYTLLVDAHMKRGLVDDALRYFDACPSPHSVISYTAAISGLVRNALPLRALSLFRRMLAASLVPNEITFATVLKASANLSEPPSPRRLGSSLFGLIVKTNFDRHVSVCNSLITTLARTGDAGAARRVFDGMGERDVVSWTAMVDAHFESGDSEGARRVFESMPRRNEVSWSTMVARLSQIGEDEEALRVFVRMLREGCRPNASCIACALSASAGCGILALGADIHSVVSKSGLEADPFVASSLVNMYSKCGRSQDGRRVFDSISDKNVAVWNSMLGGYCCDGRVDYAEEIFRRMPDRNVVTWNTMISGYDRNERYSKVLETFDEMLAYGQLPTQVTFSSVLHSCANLPSLEKGKSLHGKTVRLGLETQVFVGTALIDMYSKCGDVESAKRVFDAMPDKNEVSWTVMIQGLADSGLAHESLELFEECRRTSSIVPNGTMFLSVLAACSHRGLVDEGLRYLESMEKEYGIPPSQRHYTSMVNLLARVGLLREAEEFIGRMPVEPEAMSWAALLSSCCTYREEEIGGRAAKKVMELGAAAGGYVLVSNMYASVGRWKEAARARRLMREAGLKKGGGSSWIEIRSRFHPFYSWDANHIELLEIYRILELLVSEMAISNSNASANGRMPMPSSHCSANLGK